MGTTSMITFNTTLQYGVRYEKALYYHNDIFPIAEQLIFSNAELYPKGILRSDAKIIAETDNSMFALEGRVCNTPYSTEKNPILRLHSVDISEEFHGSKYVVAIDRSTPSCNISDPFCSEVIYGAMKAFRRDFAKL